MQKKQPFSYATHRKRTKDNLVFVFVILLILWFASSCSSERKGCTMNRGMVGYGNR